MSYRVEVERSAFEGEQEQDFIKAASKAGHTVTLIRNRWALAIFDLSEESAVRIRDGLERLDIHASIGITSPAEQEKVM